MIDHLFKYDDEAAAQAALPDFYIPASDEGPASWRGDCCIPAVAVYTVTGTEPVTDPETGETYEREIREYLPGWFLWITGPELIDDPAVMVAADYEAWVAVADDWSRDSGDTSWVVKGELDPAIQISPVFGREKPYPFGE